MAQRKKNVKKEEKATESSDYEKKRLKIRRKKFKKK